MSQAEHNAIVAGLRAGEPAAFDRAYEQYRAKIYGFLIRMTGQRSIADDLLQETFVRLARTATRLAEDTHLSGWLFTVARNLARSQLRWARVDAHRMDELALASVSQLAPSPHHLVEGQEFQRRLEAAIVALPLPHREAIILVGVEGMTPAAAARVIGIRPEAMRQRLSRARSRLAETLGDSQPCAPRRSNKQRSSQ